MLAVGEGRPHYTARSLEARARSEFVQRRIAAPAWPCLHAPACLSPSQFSLTTCRSHFGCKVLRAHWAVNGSGKESMYK